MKTVKETLVTMIEEMNKAPEKLNRNREQTYYKFTRRDIFSNVNGYIRNNFKLDTEQDYDFWVSSTNESEKYSRIQLKLNYEYPNGDTVVLTYTITLEVSMGKGKLGDTEFRKIQLGSFYMDNRLEMTADELFNHIRTKELMETKQKLTYALEKKEQLLVLLAELSERVEKEDLSNEGYDPTDWKLKDMLEKVRTIPMLRERLGE